MLTLAEVKAIDFTKNTCEVHIPIFDAPGAFTRTLLTAAINITPGVHSGYAVGDTVVVGFVDSTLNKPIVLGKLYLGVTDEVSTRGIVSCDRLEVGQQATIPVTTELAFNGEPGTYIGVEGGYSSYKSILDIIDVLHTHTLELASIDRSIGSEVELRTAEARALASRTEDLATQTDENIRRIRDSFNEVETTTQTSIAEAKAEVEELLRQVNGTVADVSKTVTSHETTIKSITAWETEHATTLSATLNLTNEHEAKFTSLATWQSDTTESIATVTKTANDAKSQVTSLASWQTGVDTSIAAIRQSAEEAAAATEILTEWGGSGETLKTKLTQLATEDFVGTQITAVKEDIDAEFILGIFENDDSGSTESFATLVADKIEFEGQELNIKVQATNIIGGLTIGQLPAEVATTNDIPTSISELDNDTGYITETGVVSIVDGRVTADYVSGLGCEFTTGKIGKWCFDADGTLRSAQGVYGKYAYDSSSSNGLSNLVVTSVTGYLFTTLTNTGIVYVVKSINDYSSTTIATFQSTALIATTSSGGGSPVLPT